jgi:hypothetical protein
MRRTFLPVVAVLALVVVLAPPATADDQIPVTCTIVSVQDGWDRNGKEVFEFWLGDKKGRPDPDGNYLWHRGTGYFQANGDDYCRGFWYVDGGWWISPPPVVWPPTEDSQGHFFGTFRIELSHADIDGGFDNAYTADTVFDRERNRVYEGTAFGEGYGDLEGWEISLGYYLPYYPPVGLDFAAHTVWTGVVTPEG